MDEEKIKDEVKKAEETILLEDLTLVEQILEYNQVKSKSVCFYRNLFLIFSNVRMLGLIVVRLVWRVWKMFRHGCLDPFFQKKVLFLFFKQLYFFFIVHYCIILILIPSF